MYEAFIDLDELIVRCKDKQTKKFIREAVACYQAGAYRSCIVSTWNAVVFDFLHKLRELDILGNKQASEELKKFESLRNSHKYRDLWQFESAIPDKAVEPFEFISNVEKSDIERLFEDRSRCAHPSMTSLEEPFEATGELARYHLRSAVMHLLEREPVQGRAASERIFREIDSAYFPTNAEEAITCFRKGPLSRARFSLIKDVIIILTKKLLRDNSPNDERERQFSAIGAISSMYHEQTRQILNDKLSDIITEVEDKNLHKVIIYLERVQIWDNITEPCQLKAAAFIERLNISEAIAYYSIMEIDLLLKAYQICFLKESVKRKLQIPLEELYELKIVLFSQKKYNITHLKNY